MLEVTVDALESLLSRARRTLKNALRPLLEPQETLPCTTQPMTLDEFETHLDRYGADLDSLAGWNPPHRPRG